MTFKSSIHVLALLLFVAVSITALTASAQTGSNLLVSVTFKTDNPVGNTPLISGLEPAATGANPSFGAANVWNNLPVPYQLNTNPSWTSLVDSTGTATGISLSITGTVSALDLYPWIPNPDPLRTAFLGWNSWINGGGGFGAGESTSIQWTLSGLPPHTHFEMCVYGGVADHDRAFDMTIQGVRMSIPTFNSASAPLPSCVLFANLTSDAHGRISGLAAGVGDGTTAANEANWSGFQLLQVPKPSQNPRIGFQRAQP